MAKKGDTEKVTKVLYSGQKQFIFTKQQLSLTLGYQEKELIFYCVYGDIQNSKALGPLWKEFP